MSIEVATSAFAKAASNKRPKKPASTGRVLTGAFFPGWHGAIAGKKGHKLKAVGYEVGGGIASGALTGIPAIGAGVGTYYAHKQGHYKVQKNLSAFGVEHPESIAKAENPRQLMTLQRIAGMKVKGVPQAAKNSPRVAAAFDRANKVRPFNNKPADKINRAMARLTGVPGRNGRMAG